MKFMTTVIAVTLFMFFHFDHPIQKIAFRFQPMFSLIFLYVKLCKNLHLYLAREMLVEHKTWITLRHAICMLKK